MHVEYPNTFQSFLNYQILISVYILAANIIHSCLVPLRLHTLQFLLDALVCPPSQHTLHCQVLVSQRPVASHTQRCQAIHCWQVLVQNTARSLASYTPCI